MAESVQPYLRQATSYRRTELAIINGAKRMISQIGFRQMNMIDLAVESQVSRATLYNHFRDKEAVGLGLIAFEVSQLVSIPNENSIDYLVALSQSISTNPALASIRKNDPELIAKVFQPTGHVLWREVGERLNQNLGGLAPAVVLWLLGQFLAPISEESARKQALAILNR